MFSRNTFIIIALFFLTMFTMMLVNPIPVRAQLQIAKLWLQPLPSANSLPNPVPKQRFIDTWGAPRGGGRKHEGVDIFAKRGTPVVSNIDGVVWKMENNRLGGTSVWLIGAGGAFHYYTHLHKYADIQLYQYVKQGQVIAYVGNTGNARTTPPHLHYGIYVNGKAINPYPLLNKKS
ncbi:Glycyl-glycine endopeptidase ALE-1 precursor [Alysiella crassa]|uniref:Glycyl-glycine endopeptidase ALE-1 n=2 Tax=Alysiella crassa TaxID=153491 RepID=A0A376BVX7_9NEIS|nr:Glycyl-glycine endopeptidase ALE-1 precursor [Alysiella crassa]